HPQLAVGVRGGANDVNHHFNSIRLGQGANMALPIFGEFMQHCMASNTYNNWKNLHFPVPTFSHPNEIEAPEFKEQLNFIDRLTNRKLEKVKHPETPSSQPAKEGFFKRLFKRKKNKS
ncbi:MAG: peptidoglycan glycosyltransferase, partial [Odoribacter sp.]|nr:peptidoglycan glycosyltransferase [Odoribacter sp.]